jgi:hypothetical protein
MRKRNDGGRGRGNVADPQGAANAVDRRRERWVTVDVGESLIDGVVVVVAVGEVVVVAHTDGGWRWYMRV